MKSEIWIYRFVTCGWSQQADQHNAYKTNLMLQLPARKSQVFFLLMCNWPDYSGSFCFFLLIMYFLQKYLRQATAKEAKESFLLHPCVVRLAHMLRLNCPVAMASHFSSWSNYMRKMRGTVFHLFPWGREEMRVPLMEAGVICLYLGAQFAQWAQHSLLK